MKTVPGGKACRRNRPRVSREDIFKTLNNAPRASFYKLAVYAVDVTLVNLARATFISHFLSLLVFGRLIGFLTQIGRACFQFMCIFFNYSRYAIIFRERASFSDGFALYVK